MLYLNTSNVNVNLKENKYIELLDTNLNTSNVNVNRRCAIGETMFKT